MLMLILSLTLQCSALVWSVLLLRRYRDRRLVVVPLVVAVMAVDPVLRLYWANEWESGFPAAHTLAESILVLLVPILFGRYFRSQRDTLDTSRRNEALFRALAENSLGLICQHDLDGVLLFINPAAAEALGYQPGPLIGKSVRTALAPSFRDEFDAYLERIRSRKADSGLMRVVTGDGSERVWLYRNVIHELPGARPTVLGHALDITELKGVEKQLRTVQRELETRVRERTAELARFRAVLDQAGAAIYICDETHHFIDVNETACRLTGYSRQELLRMRPTDLVAGYDVPDAWAARSGDIATTGESIATPDHYHCRKDGSRFPVRVTVTSRSFEGKTFVLAVAQDITEEQRTEDALRQAEEELRQLFASVSDYLWSADVSRDGQVTYRYYSPVVERITGRPPEFYLPSPERWLSTIHPEDRPKLLGYVTRMIEGNSAVKETEYRIVRPDDSVRWLRDSVTGLSLKDGVTRLNGVVSDITERKNAESERLKLEGQLRQSQRLESIGVLAGGIAHDFNNILTSILGFAGLVEADLAPGSPQRANIQEVLRAGERAKELVLQILTFSQRGGQQRRPVDVAAAVSQALALMRSSIPFNVELRQKIHLDCGDVLADLTCIHRIVLNLAINAFHALEASGGMLEVSVEPVQVTDHEVGRHAGLSPGPYAKLTVSDDGPGVDPQIREQIFDPFFTTKEVGKGTGLGLSMVHGIVTSYGGVVELEDRPSKGATFAVYLPQVQREAEVEPETSNA
jgi:PAS domain S-box-containing protein